MQCYSVAVLPQPNIVSNRNPRSAKTVNLWRLQSRTRAFLSERRAALCSTPAFFTSQRPGEMGAATNIAALFTRPYIRCIFVHWHVFNCASAEGFDPMALCIYEPRPKRLITSLLMVQCSAFTARAISGILGKRFQELVPAIHVRAPGRKGKNYTLNPTTGPAAALFPTKSVASGPCRFGNRKERSQFNRIHVYRVNVGPHRL